MSTMNFLARYIHYVGVCHINVFPWLVIGIRICLKNKRERKGGGGDANPIKVFTMMCTALTQQMHVNTYLHFQSVP